MSIVIESIGSRMEAEAVCARAARVVTGYSAFLKARGWQGGPIQSRPLTDKPGYIAARPFSELVGDDIGSTFSIIASSGSSGKPLYWPQLKSGHASRLAGLRTFLESGFGVQERPTIAVVGLALGSWIGGDMVSSALKGVAATVPYPLAVFVPGSRHDEILRFLHDAAPMLGERGQFLVFVCPSAIGHLSLLAESTGGVLPHDRLRYAVLGEPFPEALRVSLRSAAGLDAGEAPILSIYGSADTGVLGAESQASTLLRTVLHEHPTISESLGLTPAPPHFFHAASPDAYLETIRGELCVTRWQGIPLMRYNLHDHAMLLSWTRLRDVVVNADISPELKALVGATSIDLPDVIAVFGRSDRCLILCGTNISEAMLDAAVAGAGLDDVLTRVYRASIVYEQGRQRLAIDLETRRGATHDRALEDRVYAALIRSLGETQPEFADDWKNVYRAWDDQPDRRVLRIGLHPWPDLSERRDGAIKNRGVVQ